MITPVIIVRRARVKDALRELLHDDPNLGSKTEEVPA